jgi:hypothetical protein
MSLNHATRSKTLQPRVSWSRFESTLHITLGNMEHTGNYAIRAPILTRLGLAGVVVVCLASCAQAAPGAPASPVFPPSAAPTPTHTTAPLATTVPSATTVPTPVKPVLDLRHGLIGEWHLDGDAKDTSGNGNDGALAGNVTFTPGRYGKALALNRVALNGVAPNGAGDYVTVPDSASLKDGQTGLTVAAWVKMERLPAPNTYYAPIAKEHSYRFIISPDGGAHFVVATSNNGWYADGTVAGLGTRLSAGEWYHLAATYDGHQLRVYVNGALDGMGGPLSGYIAAHAKQLGRNAETVKAPLTFGAKTSGNLDYTAGLIDEVRVYDRALSDDEVSALYDAN